MAGVLLKEVRKFKPILIIMKPKIERFLALVSVLAFLMIAGTGCKNTAHGAGEDIEKVGEKIQEKTR